MRKNIDFEEKVIWDYRKKIIIDKNNPILAFKANRDRYSARQGELVGKPYLGSNASEDALTWNVFLSLYEAKKLGYVFHDYKLGRIRALALWSLTPDTKFWNKNFQFEIGHALRTVDGKIAGQMSEPDVAILGSSAFCIIECKLGYPNKPLSHLWEGFMESINKRFPVYLKRFEQFTQYQNEKSVFYYQLIRMAFYAMVLAERYKVTPHLVTLMNENNWQLKFGTERISPEDIWADFCNVTRRIFPELNLSSLFWQKLITIPEVRRMDKLYRYLVHHPCLV